MAQTSTGRKPRPLSPHLEIWRWGPAMLTSILHRASGVGLAIGGLGTLLCWLGAMASGADAYTKFAAIAGSLLGRLVLIGISWAFFNHLASGVRHFLLDIGAGFEVKSNNIWSMLTTVLGVVLTAAFWAVVLLR
jgi:succinate dehydrogenase / fumarate reductase cytochrome b subunit